ncbi:hypothetical protein FA13DRAFT_499556 [Coprinellus micaceus]|uniref:Uncharacterized protein n=1 Tax=Coprinellus micaceus TaxID=71717 RepID=A0A4Y7TBB1_COPMI|nr:hypothetical protein FA13DRAFT_499556 [Coprinellus micaceus]
MSDSHTSSSCASDLCRSLNGEEGEEVCNMEATASCPLREYTVANSRLPSPNSDLDSDDQAQPTCGQESLPDTILAKRKPSPPGSSEGPSAKKSNTVCKRCAAKHGRECVLPPGGRACILCSKSKKSCSLGTIRRPRKSRDTHRLGSAAAIRAASCGETTNKLMTPRFVSCVRPREAFGRDFLSVPRLIRPSTFGGTSSQRSLAAPQSICPAPCRETPSRESSVPPRLSRAASRAVAPAGLNTTTGSPASTPDPMSPTIDHQTTDHPPSPAPLLHADNLSGISSQPSPLNAAVPPSQPSSPSTSGNTANPFLPSLYMSERERLLMQFLELGLTLADVLARGRMGECSASPVGEISPYGPQPGNRACTCGASLLGNQGAGQAGHGRSAAWRPIPQGTNPSLSLPPPTAASKPSPPITVDNARLPTSPKPTRQAPVGQWRDLPRTFSRHSEGVHPLPMRQVRQSDTRRAPVERVNTSFLPEGHHLRPMVARGESRSRFLHSLSAFQPGEGRRLETPRPSSLRRY